MVGSMSDAYGLTAMARTALREANPAVNAAKDAVQQAARGVTTADSLKKMASIRKVAQDFEAVFLSEMLEYGFQGISSNPMTGGGFADDTYRSMQLQEYGKLMARAGGIGIADHVMRAMIERQEV